MEASGKFKGRYETDEEMQDRYYIELKESKDVLEKKLKKKIEYLCWPGGGFNDTSLEIAEKLGVHRQTVRRWTRQGLTPIDSRKPMLIMGEHAAHFLKMRKKENKKRGKFCKLHMMVN